MTLLRCADVAWAPSPNVVTVAQGPTDLPVTGAFVAVLHRRRLLLTCHARRGDDLPGGHIERDETAAAAAVRELAEETGLRLPADRVELVGHIRIDVEQPPASYRYPTPSAMVIYQASYDPAVDRIEPLAADEERTGTCWVDIGSLSVADGLWVPLVQSAARLSR